MAGIDRLDTHVAAFTALIDRVAPADPTLLALKDSLGSLRAAVDGAAADANAAKAAAADVQDALRDFYARWRRELTRSLLEQLPELPPLSSALGAADWTSPDGFSKEVTLGPLTLKVGLGPVTVPLDVATANGSLALPPIAAGLGRPDEIGARLRGPMAADGALRVLSDGVSGRLRLPLGAVTVDALASLRRLPHGPPSFLAIMGVGFTPGIQLSFGFSLDRVGGIVGIERRVDLDALTRGIRAGTAAPILFSPPRGNASLGAAEALFPPAGGQHIIGPMLGLSWLSLGPERALVHADACVAVQLGGPVTIVVVGSARFELGPFVRVRADLSGQVDLARGRVGLDVSLVEARVLGAFRLTGDGGFRAITSGPGAVAFTAGGFYPGFDPKPADFGPLRRLALATDIPTPGLSLRVEGYCRT